MASFSVCGVNCYKERVEMSKSLFSNYTYSLACLLLTCIEILFEDLLEQLFSDLSFLFLNDDNESDEYL